MILKNLFIRFGIVFPVGFAAAVLVTYLWNLISHGQSAVDWETAFRLAIMLGIALPVARAVEEARRVKKK